MKLSPTEYYDLIADEYNSMLSTDKDLPIRKDVAQYVKNNVRANTMLDFGGGTGLDVNWLSKLCQTLYFYEPAEKMNDKAKQVISQLKSDCEITNLTTAFFNDWQHENNEALQLCDMILMNFGVINYIEKLEDFFLKLTSITADNADLMISLLLPPNKVRYTRLLKSKIASILKGKSQTASSVYKGFSHETKLYKLKEIEIAARHHFDLIKTTQLGEDSDFYLLHFRKHEKNNS